MAMVAHDPAAAKRLGIPQSVGKEFVAADKGRKFAKGGHMATKAMEQRHARTLRNLAKEEEKEAAEMKYGGKVKKMAGGGYVRAADGVAKKGKTKAKQITMKRGGKC